MTTEHAQFEAEEHEAPIDRRWLAAIVMVAAALMDMLDVTVVNVALPTIGRRLHAGPTAIEWVVSGYMLSFAALLIVAGRLGDAYGRKRLFMVGVAAFGITSLLAGLSQSPGQLIAGRLLQGASAAILMPQVLATFRAIFDREDRAKAFGVYGAIAGLAAALGVILGGIITQANLFGLSWRAVFLVNVPVVLVVLVAGARLVPETRDPQHRRLDVVGAAALAVGIAAIVYPLLVGRQHGWPAWCFALLAGGILVIAGLAAVERLASRRGVAPLIDTRQFTIPAFSAGLVVQLLFSLGLQGFSLVFILWLQSGHGFSPIHAGLTLVAFSVGAIITAPNAAKLAVARGRRILVAGAALMVIGTAGVGAPAWIGGQHITTWLLAPGFVVSGAGLGLLIVPLVNVVLAAVPAATAGRASGVFSTAQQLGGAIGIALIGSVFFSRLDHHASYDAAFGVAISISLAAYALCAVLACVLPARAVDEEEAFELLR